jgi:uncharacterized protein YjiS (DUF1127 family)
MKRIFPATVIAIAVTNSIVSRLLAAGVQGSTASGVLAGLQSRTVEFMHWLKSLFDDWVVAMLARREQQATMVALGRLNDRELRDIGLYRDDIAYGQRFSEWKRQHGVSTRASASRPVNGRR